MNRKETFGWCFIGSGKITRRVMNDLSRYAKISRLAAVYSPHFEHAKELADRYNAKAYTTAEEAILADGVDGVYIATPHTAHFECAELALKLKKPVLCEKPLTPNLKQSAALFELAREKNLYLAEGMWTRYNPVILRVAEWIRDGRIGKVHYMDAVFAGNTKFDPTSRLFLPELAGGALPDIGIYTVALSQMVYGDCMPAQIRASGNLCSTGVDTDCSILLKYPDGGLSSLFTSLSSNAPANAKICGEKGYILIDAPFWRARKAALHIGDITEAFEMKSGDYEGFHFEFDSVAEEIRSGRKESVRVPAVSTGNCAAIMDEVRRQIGVRYPFE